MKALKFVLAPLARRIGTMAAAALVARDIPADQVSHLMQALGVVLALTFDILVANRVGSSK